jgi:putative nucleotidyltransferase with HDIG domain
LRRRYDFLTTIFYPVPARQGINVLKRIARDQITTGMFLHSIEGSWFAHPFLKAKFLVSNQEDVDALRMSDVDAVMIDTSKGIDVPPANQVADVGVTMPDDHESGAKAKTPKRRPRRRAPDAKAEPDAPCTMAEEFGRANQIVFQSREVMVELFDQVRLGKIVDAEMLAPLADAIAGSVARNKSTLSSILRLKTADEYTYMHSVAVAALMIGLARELGLDADVVRDAGVAGLLHDLGKAMMPHDILSKPGKLTDEEFAIMRTHPQRGYDLLIQAGIMPQMALDVCLHHHEKMDGTGYPEGLKGDQISLAARMGAICDVYDAVTSNRPYKKPWSATASLKTMYGWKGHFDPVIFTAFVRSVGIYPVGTLVRLKSDRLAFVSDINARDLTRPIVRPFYSIPHASSIRSADLNLLNNPSGDAIISSEAPEKWGLEDWEAQWQKMAAS